MTIYQSKEKYGFVYIWYDRYHKRFYVGCHWGSVDDGYICSSNWMRDAYKKRPEDFKRRILKTGLKIRSDIYIEEQRYFDMIKPEELRKKYYNLNLSSKKLWHQYPDDVKTVGQKISASKKGKKTTMSSEQLAERGKTISEVKKRKFAERGGISEEHRTALKNVKKLPHTQEWKDANSKRMTLMWSDGTRKRAAPKEPKQTMSRDDQDKLCSMQLKTRWSDPIWSANQRAKLKEAWTRRKRVV